MPDIAPLDFWTRIGAAAIICVFMWQIIGFLREWNKSQQTSYSKRDESNSDILKSLVDIQQKTLEVQHGTVLATERLGDGMAAALIKLDEHMIAFAAESAERDVGLHGDIAKVQGSSDTILLELRTMAEKTLGIVQALSDAKTALDLKDSNKIAQSSALLASQEQAAQKTAMESTISAAIKAEMEALKKKDE